MVRTRYQGRHRARKPALGRSRCRRSNGGGNQPYPSQHRGAAAQQEVAGIQGTYRITGDRPPIERDPGSPLLAALIKTVEQTTGAPAQVSYFTGYTDTAVIAGTYSDYNCMSYGPESLALAHKPNEWVPRDDIQRVEAVLTDLLLSQSGLA